MRENSTPKIGISNDRKNELQLGETNSNANQKKMGTTTKNGKSAEFLFHLYYLVNRKTDSWFCNSRDFKKNYEANEKKKTGRNGTVSLECRGFSIPRQLMGFFYVNSFQQQPANNSGTKFFPHQKFNTPLLRLKKYPLQCDQSLQKKLKMNYLFHSKVIR